MKNLLKNIGTTNIIGLVIVSTIILPLIGMITVKVLNTSNIIF